MSYKVLYRKYRPDSFNKIVGQKTIVENLKNSIITGNFAHAYLFTGPRGTGKTSTAKVLAKAINCNNRENGEACGKCKNCQDFATSPDIIEIDAASNNGVDEIRELRNNVTLAPSESNYKVYIIDEVHMLSPGAFNALLKTLEEPPSHVIFILATTEVYKVPITILSRCQRYDFQKIDQNSMLEHLKDICQKEKIEFELRALEEIYSLSDGCLRDALSLLDQTSKMTNKITLETILESYNIISDKTIDEILTATYNNDLDNLLSILQKLEDGGMNAQKLIKKVINYLEKIAINIKLKKETRFDFEKINKTINELNEIYIEARINENVFTLIKLAFIKQIQETSDKPIKKIVVPELKESTPGQAIVVAGNSIDIRINNCFVEASKTNLSDVTEIWKSIDNDKLADINLSEYVPVAASTKYAIFTGEEESLIELFNIKSETIEKLLKKNKLSIKVVAVTTNRWQEEKEKYKQNVRKGLKYEYIDEPSKELIDSKIDATVGSIFTDSPVEVS